MNSYEIVVYAFLERRFGLDFEQFSRFWYNENGTNLQKILVSSVYKKISSDFGQKSGGLQRLIEITFKTVVLTKDAQTISHENARVLKNVPSTL